MFSTSIVVGVYEYLSMCATQDLVRRFISFERNLSVSLVKFDNVLFSSEGQFMANTVVDI